MRELWTTQISFHWSKHDLVKHFFHRCECFPTSPCRICTPTNIQCIQASGLHYTHFVAACVWHCGKILRREKTISQRVFRIHQTHTWEEVLRLPHSRTCNTQSVLTKLYTHSGISPGSTCYQYRCASVTTTDFQKVRIWLLLHASYEAQVDTLTVYVSWQ